MIDDQDLLYRLERLEALVAYDADEATKTRQFVRGLGDGSIALESPRSGAFVDGETQVVLAANAYYDGTSWQRRDIASGGSVLALTVSGGLEFYRFGAGANPVVFTTPSTILTGDRFALVLDPPRAAVYRSTNQSIGSGAHTALSFDTVRQNVQGAFSGGLIYQGAAPTRLTANIAGWYDVGASAAFATGAGTARLLSLRLNGATFKAISSAPPLGGGNQTYLTVRRTLFLAAADYVEACAFQDTGGALNVASAGDYSPEAWMLYRSF